MITSRDNFTSRQSFPKLASFVSRKVGESGGLQHGIAQRGPIDETLPAAWRPNAKSSID